jgi:6-phosphogluconolactonase
LSHEIHIEVVADPATVCAEQLSAAAATGGHVVLTGGSTPATAYERCAEHHADDWRGAKLWFTDDRCVEPDSELSNSRLVTEKLLDPLAAAGVTPDFCRRVMGEHGFEQGGDEYEQALREAGFTGEGADGPRFELVLIGVGSDGHICSMFPGQRSLSETERLAVGVPIAGLEPFVPRVTLTFAALALAKRVLVLATGAGKADAISAAFAQDAPADEHVPASLLKEHVPRVTVLLDDAAASRL